jgi:transcription initiation factor TFIIIB Brf1 subunit/transcription initiation factor TFIIB
MVNYCHECGGEMHYVSLTKNYVCKSCGLSCTGQDLNDVRDKRQKFDDDDEKTARRKEYLKWYLSKK